MDWVILVIIGFFGGTIGSLVGLGGGIIVVPSLLLFSYYTPFFPSLSPQIIVGISIIILIVTGLSSTLAYLKQKKVDVYSGIIFFIGSGPGAYIGALINKTISFQGFSIYFGGFMIFISLLLMIRGHLKPLKLSIGKVHSFKDEEGREYTYRYSAVLAVFIAFFVGVLSGLFGIGGGSLMVPVMLLLFGFPTSVAIATSMFLVFLSALVGSIAHIRLGNVHWLYVCALIPGAWFGGKFGAYLNEKLADDTVVKILRGLLMLVGVRLIWQGFMN
ncbi:sulfite exporter TauE/SafE family protein [Bacillus taeanensis]|uniref:Probable membrane transporter protein n=1 Tax=Bacillus taeanensis TaxID=273032 RepID=A0A366Y4G0_9BACI|nr:sulfite exporter TauE/SafE family protein [Bacillus taeanensis]RBW71274.1 hypothetical protein DS031_00550 [Bacillus taeanensis]